ncbi:MAG: hypothetical protein HY023_09565, partial [Chloroflexi bacterium]|nr:hypothetical protein [Chloroflexota bacterium]
METHSGNDEDPLKPGRAARKPRGANGRGLRVALLYNVKENAPSLNGSAPPDIFDELDSLEDVRAYTTALRAGGHTVYPMEGDPDL